MASTSGALMRSQIKLAKPLLKAMDLDTVRLWQDRLGEWGARALKDKVEYRMERFDRFEADWAVPGGCVDRRAILYLHGGSYTCGTLYYARGFGGVLAEATGIPALCVGYRLAPEHPFPAALDDALEAYDRLLETHAPQELIVAGESAGGGLTFALLLKLKELGRPLPACAVALSPWADLTCSAQSYVLNAEKDPSLFHDSLLESAELYADGHPLTEPLVSPVYGDLAGLPPVAIFAGTEELLQDDSRMLSKKLEAAGVPCEAHFAEGMWHVYVIFGIPEAQQAIGEICDFIDRFTR